MLTSINILNTNLLSQLQEGCIEQKGPEFLQMALQGSALNGELQHRT